MDIVDERGYTLASPSRHPWRLGCDVGAADVARDRRKFFCDHRPNAGIRNAPHFYTKDDEIEAFFAEINAIRGV